jgi:hypothetical protein
MREERASGVGERALFDLRELEKTMQTTIGNDSVREFEMESQDDNVREEG